MEKEEKIITPNEALKRLERSCGLRETCSQAVQRKLAFWKIPQSEAEGILHHLKSKDLVNDERYAHAFAREKSHLAKWGELKIHSYLQAKRIPPEMIRKALSSLDASNQATTIEILLQKKAKLIKAKSFGDMYAKLVRFGVSRGYQYETVANIAETVSKSVMQY